MSTECSRLLSRCWESRVGRGDVRGVKEDETLQIQLVAGGFSKESGVGIERYSWELLSRLPKKGIRVETVSSNPRRKRYALAVNALSKVPILTFLSLGKSNIIHATDPSSAFPLPLTGRSTVVTFHDFMPLLLRADYGLGDRLFSRLAYKVAAGCKAVIAVSQQTKSEVVRYLQVPEEKVHVIPLGVSDEFTRLHDINKEQDTIGYVGDINPRKRIGFLLEGFALLRRERPNARLMIVGTNVAEYLDAERRRLLNMVEMLGIKSNVTFTGRVTEKRLIEFYNRMKVLVLPSEYEGFGLPILEAEKCGTPVITREGARISPEISLACLKVSTPHHLAETILNLLSNGEAYQKRVEMGNAHYSRFTWDASVRSTIGLYNKLLTEA